jgi:hypothetical protein
MILGILPDNLQQTASNSPARPAFPLFFESQKSIRPPCTIVLQLEHSTLAGALARELLEDAFGPLNDEVYLAVRDHDFGWQASDLHQMDLLGEINPRPFPSLSVEETSPLWHASIAHAASISALVEVLVSHHFTTLGHNDPARADFVSTEERRRKPIERSLSVPAADLERWIAALGFCDLVSLYLCSGSREPAEFPLAHPADPRAATAPKTTLRWINGFPCFSRPILKPDACVKLAARVYEGRGERTDPLCFEWRFPGA